MGTYNCKVNLALAEQELLIGYGEHCSADGDGLADIGRALNEQVRVHRGDDYALYTVAELRDEKKKTDMRMALAGRQRLGTDDAFRGVCDSECVRHDLTDAEAESQGEMVERLDESSASHTGLVILAPHGGMVENYTDEQAERAYSQLDGKDRSCWRCKGWKTGGGAYDRWHITSTELHGNSFPYLGDLEPRGFDYGVAFHGYGESDIAVGGAADSGLLQDIADAIQTVVGVNYDVNVVTSGPYAGTDPNNIVNRLTSNGGVQIEQPYSARRDFGQDIADAVATVFAALL
jgi:phage replication-related protein YjqB (UPF0714/DUF867 family)